MPNFRPHFRKFLHRRVGLEATSAAASLKEGQATDMDREELEKFSFSDYFEKMSEVAPILTTTLVAAATHNQFKDIKVKCAAVRRILCAVYRVQCAMCSVPCAV